MKNVLEELWDSYQMGKPMQMDSEKRKLAEHLQECEETLCAKLDSDQREALDLYETASNLLSVADEKDAFIAGIRFATAFLLEALREVPRSSESP